MLPKSLKDKQIRFFKFWSNHQLHDGLHYQNELFQRVQSLHQTQRRRIYEFGGELAKQGADIVITCDQETYSLWVSLRSHPRGLNGLMKGAQSQEQDQGQIGLYTLLGEVCLHRGENK